MIDATALPPSSLHEELGIEIARANAAEVISSTPVMGSIQPAGLLHRGVTAVLVGGPASLVVWLHTQPERVAVGVDLNLTHPRPIVSGRVTSRAVPVHLGSGTTVRTAGMHDEEGRLAVVGRLTSRLMVPRE